MYQSLGLSSMRICTLQALLQDLQGSGGSAPGMMRNPHLSLVHADNCCTLPLLHADSACTLSKGLNLACN